MKSTKSFSILVIFFVCSASLIASEPLEQLENGPLEVADTNQTSDQGPKKEGKIDIIACANGDWVKCGISLGKFVFSMITWQDGGQIPILGQTCTVSVRGRISSWKWVWDAKLRCPFGQEGSGRGYKSRTGAAEAATRDFFQKNAALIESMQG